MAPRSEQIQRSAWAGPPDPPVGGEAQTLEFLEEELVPRTMAVSAGELIVRKYVVSELRTVQVPVRREVVEVYRQGPAGEPVEPIGPTQPSAEATSPEVAEVIWESEAEEEVGRLPLLEEEPVVTTRLIVREEVVVRRRRHLGRRRLAEEVRREEPRLETPGS